jgi:glycosyltransferase involved in cell wall biosynthesis
MKPAVILAAWRAPRWILDAVASLAVQTRPADLVIGVDGCVETAEVLRAARVPFFWSATNVGPYLVRNTLIARYPEASHYVIFDADDVADPKYVEVLTDAAGPDGLAGCGQRYWDDARGPIPADHRRALPATRFIRARPTVSAGAWRRLGGFQPWRINGDSDLWRRATAMGLPTSVLPTAHVTARRHPASQMAAPATALRSPQRRALYAQTRAAIARGELVVTPQTVPMMEVD